MLGLAETGRRTPATRLDLVLHDGGSGVASAVSCHRASNLGFRNPRQPGKVQAESRWLTSTLSCPGFSVQLGTLPQGIFQSGWSHNFLHGCRSHLIPSLLRLGLAGRMAWWAAGRLAWLGRGYPDFAASRPAWRHRPSYDPKQPKATGPTGPTSSGIGRLQPDTRTRFLV